MLFLNFRCSIVFFQLLKQNYQRELHREMKKKLYLEIKKLLFRIMLIQTILLVQSQQ